MRFRNHQPEAAQIGIDTLKELGEELPSYPSGAQVALAQWRAKRKLRGAPDASLMRLPAMKVSRKVAAMQMLNLTWLSALYSWPLLAVAVAVRVVKLTVACGECAASRTGFGFYAMLLSRCASFKPFYLCQALLLQWAHLHMSLTALFNTQWRIKH